MDEKKINHLMTALDITREEAIQVIKDDEQIDKGAKLFNLTAEQEKASKQARRADSTPTVYKFQKRERKANTEKAMLIEQLTNAVEAMPINATVEVTNNEREFLFVYNGTKYKVTLACPRS